MRGAIDTHAHLQAEQFSRDRDEVIAVCWEAGLAAMVVVGYDIPGSLAAVELAATDARLFATAGVHPHDAKTYDRESEETLVNLAASGQIVALGEMGLDFYRNLSPREAQETALGRQLAIAADHRLPVVIHTREAVEEAFKILAAWARTLDAEQPRGVMHCYSGTLEQARRFVDIGFLISIPATITYPRNDEQRRVAAELPIKSLVVETDSPYLPPQALRGKRNDPRNVYAALAEVARVRGQPEDEIVKATADNARRLLKI